MDKQSIVEAVVGLWLLVERFLTARKAKQLKDQIEGSVATIAAHVPTLQAELERAAREMGDPSKPPATAWLDKNGPKRKK